MSLVGAESETSTSIDSAPPIESSQTPSPSRWSVRLLLERYGLLLLFGLVLLVFSLATPGFSVGTNFQSVFNSQVPLAIMAIAGLIPLVVGQFDLSFVAIAGIASIVLATMMSRFHQPLVVAVICAVVAGAILGLANGIMVARVGVNCFITTLAMATILEGLAQFYTGGSTINSGISQHLLNASVGNLGFFPRALIWLIPVAALAWYFLEQTPTGRHLRAIGSNAGAAKLSGLPVRRLTASTFVLAGAVAAIGGILLVGQSGDADPETTLGALLLPALAAIFLGASAIRPGSFNVAGTVLAVYFVAFIVSGLEFLGAATWVEPVLDGVVLAAAVTISTRLSRHRKNA